jgi:hypothetical protein
MRSAMLEALVLIPECEPAPAKPRAWTSAEWVAYFRRNAGDRIPIPWDQSVPVSADELETLIRSLRSWQIGETSDGAHLRRAAARYAVRAGDPHFAEAMSLFVAEEQGHGELLGRFLDSIGVPRKRFDLGEFLFRMCRHGLTRVETNATVIVMVEVLAVLYYGGVRRATGSPVLRAVCGQLLRDEVAHLRFHGERLALLHRGRGRALGALTRAAHQAFFVVLVLAVWVGHRRALRAGGFTFGRYWSTAWARMRRAWRAMDPRTYTWTDATVTGSRTGPG